MKNIKLYKDKLITLQPSLTNKDSSLRTHNRRAIPVVVIDILTNKSKSFKSINHAARSLNEHPKSL
jgi:hypothetical protein